MQYLSCVCMLNFVHLYVYVLRVYSICWNLSIKTSGVAGGGARGARGARVPPHCFRFYILAVYNNYEQPTLYKPMVSHLNLAVYRQHSMLTVNLTVCSYDHPQAQ